MIRYECAVSLKKAGAKTVSGFVVHAVCPGGGWKRFLKGGDRAVFKRFWISSSNPAVCDQIPSGDIFTVPRFCGLLLHTCSLRTGVTLYPGRGREESACVSMRVRTIRRLAL